MNTPNRLLGITYKLQVLSKVGTWLKNITLDGFRKLFQEILLAKGSTSKQLHIYAAPSREIWNSTAKSSIIHAIANGFQNKKCTLRVMFQQNCRCNSSTDYKYMLVTCMSINYKAVTSWLAIRYIGQEPDQHFNSLAREFQQKE